MRKDLPIFEDATMAFNRWTQGIAARELNATKVGLSDIIGKTSRPDKPKKPLHPILDKTPETVGGLILNLTNLKMKIKQALNSNLTQKETNKIILKRLLKKVERNLRFINSITRDFESLS